MGRRGLVALILSIVLVTLLVPLVLSASNSDLGYGVVKNPTANMQKVQYLGDGEWVVKAEASKVKPISVNKKTTSALLKGNVNSWAKKGDKAIIHVLFYNDVNDKQINSIIKNIKDTKKIDSVKITVGTVVTLEINPDLIMELAENHEVSYLQETNPAPVTNNDESRELNSVNPLHTITYDLTGAGIIAAEWDAGCASHIDYNSRTTCADGSGLQWHSTHVAGTMLGNGNNSENWAGTPYQWKGMAPNATLISYDWWYVNSTNFTEFHNEYNESINIYNATISQNSWGIEPNPWNSTLCDDFLGEYYLESNMIDDIVRGSKGKYMVIVWSAGNTRSETCGTTYGKTFDTIGTYATAKNIITVGGSDKDTTMSSYSSWGPTNDGRIKPDIVATGTSITSTFTSNTYSSATGTSMAAPAVSGIVALLQEKIKQKYPEYNSTSNLQILPSTIKGILIQTAKDYGNTGPDYEWGWGQVNATEAIDLIESDNENNTRFYEGQINSSKFEYNLTNYNMSELKVTLVWDDYPGSPQASVELVNDLDLYLVGPDSTIYRPWILDKDSPSTAATTGIDVLNNVEQVIVTSATYGNYTVVVNASSIAYGPQNYSLILTYYDKTSPTINLTLPIDGYNSTNETVIFNCSATDASNISSISLWGNWSGWHSNETNTSSSNSTTYDVSFNKTLEDGDYTWNCRACDTYGNCALDTSRTFTVDLLPPVIGGLNAISITNSSAVIYWNTNELANYTLVYDDGVTVFNISNSSLSTSNLIQLSNLTNATLYNYNVTSCDIYGHCNNSVTNNFTTNATPDGVSPVVTLNSPVVRYWNDSSDPLEVVFNCSASDNIGVDFISLYLTNHLNTSFGLNESVETAVSAQWLVNLSNGSYTWNCLVNDTSNNVDWGINRSILINYSYPDVVSPGIENVSNASITNESVLISWNTTEDSNGSINYGVDLNVTSFVNDSVFGKGHSISLSGLLNSTLYYYNVTSCDAAENCNTSGPYNFTTIYTDVFSPLVNLVSPNSTYNSSNLIVDFSCYVGEDRTLSNVSLYGNWSGWHTNETNTSGILNITYNFTMNLIPGEYAWNCYSCDAVGNCAYNDTNNSFYLYSSTPKMITNLTAKNKTNGAILLNWSEVIEDINDNSISNPRYFIYKNITNETLFLNTSYSIANTTNNSYTDINVSIGFNYTYVITVKNYFGDYNYSNSSNNTFSITANSVCSNDWSSWSACSGGGKTSTRTCYLATNNIQTQTSTDGCTSSSGRSSSGGLYIPRTTKIVNKTNGTFEINYSSSLFKISYTGEEDNQIKFNTVNYDAEGEEVVFKSYNISIGTATNITIHIKIPESWFVANEIEKENILFISDNEELDYDIKVSDEDKSIVYSIKIEHDSVITALASKPEQDKEPEFIEPEINRSIINYTAVFDEQDDKSLNFTIPIVIALILLLSFAVLIARKVWKIGEENKHAQVASLKKLKNHFRRLKKEGKTIAQIKRGLSKNGWDKKIIEEYFKQNPGLK